MKGRLWQLLSVLTIVGLLIPFSAPVAARQEAASEQPAAPAVQPPPPDARRAPEAVHPSQPQPPSLEELLAKIHPDLRELAQTAGPTLPAEVGQMAQPPQEPILIEVFADEGADLTRYFVDGRVMARPPIGHGDQKTQVYIGFALPSNLLKIASLAQVEAIIPIVLERNAEPEPYPADQERVLPQRGPEDWAQLRAQAEALREGSLPWSQARAFGDGRPYVRPADWFEVMPEGPHQAQDAWDRGYTGEGVTVAVLDDGIDAAHPDLMGTQKIYSSTIAPEYNGWPYVFSPISMLAYAFDVFLGTTYIADGYPGAHYVDTSHTPSVYPCGTGISCFRFTPLIDYGVPGEEHTYVISNTMSQSGIVHVGTHPDNDLRDYIWGEKVAVLVTDPNVAGVYDTVYVDLDADHDFRDEKPLTRADVHDPNTYNNMIAYRDMDGDGLADISGGMLYFIGDGVTPIPVSDWMYGGLIPGNGDLVAFSGSTFDRSYSHGTQCASNIVGQGVANAMLPEFRDLPGGTAAGAVYGMAPDAKVVNVSDIYYNHESSTIDAYIFAAVGYDACDQTGYDLNTGGACSDSDGIQITTNSYGASDEDNDGWDYRGQVVSQVQRWWAPYLQFMFSTGNGAPAYGTTAPPSPDTGIAVGASTEFGSTGWDSITDTTQIMNNDVIPFSNRGPGSRGTNGVDVVAGGAYAAGDEELNYYSMEMWGYPDGNRSWVSWGGTSRSAPVAGGVLALIYQAYRQATGNWPTHDVARALLMSSATDLNYDTFSQGAGSVNADRGTAVAGGHYGFFAMPAEWDVGDYRGNDWPGFAHVVYPGDTFTTTVEVVNPSPETIVADVYDAEMLLLDSQEFTFTVTPQMVAAESAYGSANRDNFYKAFNYFIPITATAGMDESWYNVQIPDGTDLMIVRQIYPYSQFDVNGDYTWDQRFYLVVYNWQDENGDGNVWEDLNGNGVVNFINDFSTYGELADGGYELAWDDPRTELDRWEFGRFGYNRPGGNTYEMWIHDPLERMHDGLFIGLRHLYNARAANLTTNIRYRIEFYRAEDVGWLDTSVDQVSASAAGVTTFVVTATVPNDMPPGMYQAGLYIEDPGTGEYDGNTTVIPVVLNVAEPFNDGMQFGGGASAQYDALRPYNNGVVRGFFDWTWRAESGDWRFFYSDLENCAVSTIFSENFDSATPPNLPTGWAQVDVSGTAGDWTTRVGTWHPSGYSAHSEPNLAVFNSWTASSGNSTRLHTTSGLDLSAFGEATLTFWMFHDGQYSNADYIQVQASTNGTTWTDVGSPFYRYQAGTYAWQQHSVNLSAFAGQPNVYIGFLGVGAFGNDMHIDDVELLVPTCAYPAGTRFLVRDVWDDAAPYTDIDTIVFGPTPTSLGSPSWTAPEPSYFGPYVLDTVASSPNTNTGNGVWLFDTSSGANEDWVNAPFPDWRPDRGGLHAFLQHNVLFQGDQFDVVFTKTVGTLAEFPHAFDIDTYMDAGLVGTTTLTATLDLNGLQAEGFLIAPESTTWVNEPLNFTGEGTIEWVYPFSLSSAYYLEIWTSSADISDLDLYLYVWTGSGYQQIASSAGADANEHIYLGSPADGDYLIAIDNYSGPAGHFNMTMNVGVNVGGITVTGTTEDPVPANTPVALGIWYDYPMEPGECYGGLVLAGPPEAPDLKEIPLTICRLPTPGAGIEKTVDWETAFPGMELNYTINLYNYTDPAAFFEFTDPIPEGTEFVTVTGCIPDLSAPPVTLFTENFDSATPPNLPTGWAEQIVNDTGTDPNWDTNAGTRYPSGNPAHSAPNLVYFNSFSVSSGGSGRLYRTVGLDLSSAALPRLSFWMFHDTGYTSSADRVQVQVSTDGGTTWQDVGAPVPRYDGSTGWKEHVVDLSAFAGQSDVRIGFLGISGYGNDVHIDDVAVSASACKLPVYDADNNRIVYTGTLPLAQVAASVESFETGDPIFPTGWYAQHLGATTWQWTVLTAYPHSGSSHAWIRFDSAAASDEWLFSAPFTPTATDNEAFFWAESDTEYCPAGGIGATMKVHVTQPDGTPIAELWDMCQDENWPTWAYRQVFLDLSAYAGQEVRLAWQYVGLDGESFALDDVSLPGTRVVLPSATVFLTVRITDTIAAGSWITNTGTLVAYHLLPQETQVEAPVEASAVTHIGAEDFATSFKEAPAEVVAGETMLYEMHVINSGDALAYVEFNDVLPAGTTYVDHWSSPYSAYYTYDPIGDQVEWAGNIGPGDEIVFYLEVEVTDDMSMWHHTITNTAHILWDGYDMPLTASTTILPPSGIYLPLILRNVGP